jgi:hypothetical protein
MRRTKMNEKLFDPKVDKVEFVPPKSLVKAELLCQDLEKRLAVWFEKRLDARETFRRWRCK